MHLFVEFREFKTFAIKGSVVDMAVGIIIGAGFGKIVTSMVNDVIMPPIGLLIGGVDFKDLKVVLQKATETAPAVTLNYGSFIQVVFDFLIVSIAVFMLVKALNIAKAKRKKEEAPVAPDPAPEPVPTKEEILLTEIRDLLKK